MQPLKLFCVVQGAAIALAAQLQAQSLDEQAVRCKGEVITRIDVDSRPPFEVRGSRLHQRVARGLTRVHATTTHEIIRRYLVFKTGDPCTELRRAESERILRAQPFLAEAVVSAYPDGENGVRIAVTTVDETSLILGGGASSNGPHLRALRIGESNLAGRALHAELEWRNSELFRDELYWKFMDYQLLGYPVHLRVQGARRELGSEWELEASHPFFTDLQRFSWRTTAGSRHGYRYFKRGPDLPAALRVLRTHGDMGGVARIGPPGQLALVGASTSYEREMPSSSPVTVGPGFVFPDTSNALFRRYPTLRAFRVNALAGIRIVRFITVNGFETLEADQDFRTGLEIAGLFGKGLRFFGAKEEDVFVSSHIYTAAGNERALFAMEVLGEGRRDPETSKWDGLLASGRAAGYFRMTPRNTLHASMEWSAGWNQRLPFQLTFSEPEGGPRGFRRSWLAGGRRMVLRVEDRINLGRVKQFAAVGVAPFVDVGKLWAGDAPFGIDTPNSYAVGIGLLASVPPRSQRVWRLDLAVPVSERNGARVELRLTNRNFTRVFWREPEDLRINREMSIPVSIFSWP